MVLVTGGTGFLGSVLITRLITAGVHVRAIKRNTSIIPDKLKGLAGLQWVDADINDFFALGDAFEGIDKVYHCAGMISYHAADKERLSTINVSGTANIVNLALERRTRLLHVSSIAAMGKSKHQKPVTENDLWEYGQDRSGYAISKYEGEMEVWRGIAEGLEAVIVNPALIIGPGARTADNGATGTIFALLRKGLDFYPGGSVGLIDVDDTAKAMILLMDNPAITRQRFLLSNVNMHHRDLLARCSQLLDRAAPKYKATPLLLSLAWRLNAIWALITAKPPLLTRETASAASQHLSFSNQKIISATGITFKPIDETLQEICTELLTAK